MSYLRYLCLFVYSVFCSVCLRLVSCTCVPNVASFSGLFFIAPSVFSVFFNVYLNIT